MSKPSIVRLLTLGDSGAGKSSLLVRYTQDEFTHEYMPTIGIDFRLKTLTVGGRTVKVQVWDTAGQERFRTITHSMFMRSKQNYVAIEYACTARPLARAPLKRSMVANPSPHALPCPPQNRLRMLIRYVYAPQHIIANRARAAR